MLTSIRRASGRFLFRFFLLLIALIFLSWGLMDWQPTSGRSEVVARVGDESIPMEDYRSFLDFRARQLMQQLPNLTLEQLQSFGFDRHVLSDLIGQKLWFSFFRDAGLVMEDNVVASEIATTPTMQGKTMAEIRQQLASMGLPEHLFLQQVKGGVEARLSRHLFAASKQLEGRPLKAWNEWNHRLLHQTKLAKVWRVDANSLDVREPSEEVLSEYYNKQSSMYAMPDYRSFEWITFPLAVKQSDVTEDRVASYYRDHPELFTSPPRIVLYQWRSARAEDLEKIAEKIRPLSEKSEDFRDILTNGRSLPGVSSGERLEYDDPALLPEAWGKKAWDLPEGSWIGPVESPLGWHLLYKYENSSSVLAPLSSVRDSVERVVSNEMVDSLAQDIQSFIEDAVEEGEDPASWVAQHHGKINKIPLLDREGRDTQGKIFAVPEEIRSLWAPMLSMVHTMAPDEKLGSFRCRRDISSSSRPKNDPMLHCVRWLDHRPSEVPALSALRAEVIQHWQMNDRRSRARDQLESIRQLRASKVPLEEESAGPEGVDVRHLRVRPSDDQPGPIGEVILALTVPGQVTDVIEAEPGVFAFALLDRIELPSATHTLSATERQKKEQATKVWYENFHQEILATWLQTAYPVSLTSRRPDV
jgi:peptidyl-prolyl cis-trans isomerase D